MTILPKAKSSVPKSNSREARDQPNSAPFDQSVGGNGTGSGWGAGGVVGPSSGSGWSPGGPPVPGPSSSPRWNPSAVGAGTGSGLGQVEGGQSCNAKKRPAPTSVAVSQSQSDYDFFQELSAAAAGVGGGGVGGAGGGVIGGEGGSVSSGVGVGGGPTSSKRVRHCDPSGAPDSSSRTSPEPGTSGGGGCGSGGGGGGMHVESADGYNSEDEYSHLGVQMSEEEWEEKDRRFDRLMKRKGYVIKKMQEDGSCLFRAVADQIYGDQDMHHVVRDHCMNYIEQNSDYFSHYMTERVSDYVERKRFLGVHGNHLEIQALSEMYNRPIHIYCYSAEPINIFQGIGNVKSEHMNVPMRLCYHRAVHYNSLVDPHKPSIGVGLGLPNYSPGSADRNLVGQALKKSEEDAVEKTMLEDKIRATDWEATNEAIEEQVARESYLQWLRDNERRNTSGGGGGTATNARSQNSRSTSTSSATVTSGELRVDPSAAAAAAAVAANRQHPTAAVVAAAAAHLAGSQAAQMSPSRSPKPSCSFRSTSSPRAGCSSERDSPKPSGSSASPKNKSSKGGGWKWSETGSFLNGLPFGMNDCWSETDVLTQVLAASQREYLDNLKKQSQSNKSRSPSPPNPPHHPPNSNWPSLMQQRNGGGSTEDSNRAGRSSDSKSDNKQKSKNSSSQQSPPKSR